MKTFKVISPNGAEQLVKAEHFSKDKDLFLLHNGDLWSDNCYIVSSLPLTFAIIEVQEELKKCLKFIPENEFDKEKHKQHSGMITIGKDGKREKLDLLVDETKLMPIFPNEYNKIKELECELKKLNEMYLNSCRNYAELEEKLQKLSFYFKKYSGVIPKDVMDFVENI